MTNNYLIIALYFILVASSLFLLVAASYENGIKTGLLKRIRCKFGWHKLRNKMGAKYYCQYCKKPREYPSMRCIEGGKAKFERFKL